MNLREKEAEGWPPSEMFADRWRARQQPGLWRPAFSAVGPKGLRGKSSSRALRRPTLRQSGLSLLEIILAMHCTAILLAALCSFLPLARRQMHEADVRLGGAVLAANALETYMVVPLKDWPREPFALEGDWRQVQLEVAPWEKDSRLYLARATVLVGEEERYRLETLVFP